jgi:hypothetical protein
MKDFDILAIVGQARRLPGAECELVTTRLGRRSARPYKDWNTPRADRARIPRLNFADASTHATA